MYHLLFYVCWTDVLFNYTGIDKYIKCWRLTDTSTKVFNSTNGTEIGNDTVGKSTGEEDDNDVDDMNDDEQPMEEIVASIATTSITNTPTPSLGSKKKKKKKKKKKGNIDGVDCYNYPMKLELHWQYKHHAKINVIVGFYQEEGMCGVELKSSYSLIVADTTKYISIYYDT